MIYLTLSEALEIHQVLIDAFGGAPGIRDMGALEAALFRPQTGYYDNLIQEAAALMESLAMNHPFIDGNKRVAFFVTDTFLRNNGLLMDCDPDKTYSHWMTLFTTGTFDKDHLEPWIRAHIRSL